VSLPSIPPPLARRVAPDLPYRVCLVCTGNICRSPMAEVALRQMAGDLAWGDGSLADSLLVSSAGTGNWHEGEPMDPRARVALEEAGYTDHGHVAHQFDLRQVGRLDLIVALDRRHLGTLRSLAAGAPLEGRLVLLRSFDPAAGGHVDVPDPYYGDADEFARCLAMIEAGCHGLAQQLAHALSSSSTAGPRPSG
jgi:protein-tyrosine phosphatase